MTLQHTAPQNPTERVNRTVKTMVTQYLNDQQRTWDERLPEISLAINTSASETTGFSPAYLEQGRDRLLPGALYEEVTPAKRVESRGPEKKERHLQDVFKTVAENAQQASADQG